MSGPSEEISALLDSLESSDKTTIRAAVDSLIAIAARTPDIKETLTQLLLDRSRKNLWPIAYILGKFPTPPQAALKVLLDTLGTEDPDIRWAVALLLVHLGKSNQGTITLLLDLLKIGNSNQRRMALYCIRDLNLRDAGSLQAMENSLRDPDPLVRVAAVTSLKTRPDVGGEGSDFLLHLFLKDPDSRVRHSAALTLAHVGAVSEKFFTALNEASQSEDPRSKKAANSALEVLQKKRSVPTGN